jgi:hypothetical protein
MRDHDAMQLIAMDQGPRGGNEAPARCLLGWMVLLAVAADALGARGNPSPCPASAVRYGASARALRRPLRLRRSGAQPAAAPGGSRPAASGCTSGTTASSYEIYVRSFADSTSAHWQMTALTTCRTIKRTT